MSSRNPLVFFQNGRNRARLGVVLMLLSILMLGATLLFRALPERYDRNARRLESTVNDRMEVLRASMYRMLKEGVPEDDFGDDMVIYSYRNDTLVDWRNQFTVYNESIRSDDFSGFPTTRLRRTPARPLADIGETPIFKNFGPKWYVLQAFSKDNRTVIGGLLIKDLLQESDDGISDRLFHNGSFVIQPLDYGSGYEISVGETPVLMMVPSDGIGMKMPVTWPLWLALGLNILGSLLFLSERRSFRRFLVVFLWHAFSLTLIWILCKDVDDSMRLFSPVTYAGGKIYYSLGILLIFHIFYLLGAVLFHMIRRSIFRWSLRRLPAFRTSLLAACSLAVILLLCWHIHRSFTDILNNSGIFLELPKFQALSILSGLVYISFLSLTLAIPLVAQFLRPAMRYFFRIRTDSLRSVPRILFAVLVGTYFVATAGVVGEKKEQRMVSLWATRLAMDRDISLEPRLLRIEQTIRRDPGLATLVYAPDDQTEAIFTRLRDYLLRTISQNYDLAVFRLNSQSPADPSVVRVYEQWVEAGEAISSQSSFYYSTDGRGRPRYAGVFDYPSETAGNTRLVLCIESKGNREDRGYLSMLGIPAQSGVAIPPTFSYARYRYGELIAQDGNCTYPTVLPERYARKVAEGTGFIESEDNTTHFIHRVTPDQTVILSRKRVALLNYVFAAFLIAVLIASILALMRPQRRVNMLERNYFYTRIQSVLYLSLVLIIVFMAGFSAYFVGSRSRNDSEARMTQEMNVIRNQFQDRLRYYPTLSEVPANELAAMLDEIGENARCDLTIYSPEGRMVRSTAQDIYRQMLIGNRVNDEAYRHIRYGHEPSHIVTETLRGRDFDAVYGPVFNTSGSLVAFVSMPFVRAESQFSSEVVNYLISVGCLFLLLLIVVSHFLRSFLFKMFSPLVQISEKLNETDINNLEPLVYERDDEISTIVEAYNRMVAVISDSTRKLAQAERDRAWSEMARQVAHEIKNPLTPIKLRLQMLIRMKESGNPAWTEKFDETAAVVLEHIDILADTANQFSTFAKLYSEDPVEFDLDGMIQEEVLMFDAREGVHFSYFGLEGSKIVGPKPQLTRVLVNLLTNAVQAVEEQEKGEVLVSLRNSNAEGFYDIVVEDNGPGVKEEHKDKLFTPNFTTKNRGTGLGLAICRNIVERCGGTITYSRSFALGGACFTVRYPKK